MLMRDAIENDGARALVHESGHALMAILQGINCHGIYFEKNSGRFCAIADVPQSAEDYLEKHFLVAVASRVAEQMFFGNYSEEGARSDQRDFDSPNAPSLEVTVAKAESILSGKKRLLKRVVSLVEQRLRSVDYDLARFPEVGMNGTILRFAILLNKDELEAAVLRP